ncbi:Poly(U)-binding-splicing factor PUF60 [Zancudomyces culisetae]|uniref:Poly(U)-binding-splicing factor PUF60 n=1 Tax=Zancudomyces culisetae TaxID=1213189 RepID=A0A1R1PVV1_ZANCU|nr:Poly(U)-binding-splicing factor PUF60 [Zancudomyces culisetae]|eukprot:OMH85078.1 Poly(U)-binding-splicing factor PUF60 [Zancudomyces culisetae]
MDVRILATLSRIYVGSINFEMTDEHLRKIFSEYGAVKNISMSIDRNTGKHMGFGFIDFDVPESASLALENMTGKILAGSEEDLSSMFLHFGAIKKCVLSPNMLTRKHRGWGYIEFESAEIAAGVLSTMDRFKLVNQELRVRECVVGGELGEGMAILDSLPQPVLPLKVFTEKAVAGSSFGDKEQPEASNSEQAHSAQPSAYTSAAIDTKAMGQAALNVAAKLSAPLHSTDLDSVANEENLHISSKQRYSIMQKLSRGEEAMAVMFLSNTATPEEIDEDFAEDIYLESKKYGDIEKIEVRVDDQNHDVKVFVVYRSIHDAKNAVSVFDQRWFGGRKVAASIYDYEKLRSEPNPATDVYPRNQ